MVVFMVLGYTVHFDTTRRRPQIDVAMADIFIGYPGASPEEVESRVSSAVGKNDFPIIKGWSYVYSNFYGKSSDDYRAVYDRRRY